MTVIQVIEDDIRVNDDFGCRHFRLMLPSAARNRMTFSRGASWTAAMRSTTSSLMLRFRTEAGIFPEVILTVTVPLRPRRRRTPAGRLIVPAALTSASNSIEGYGYSAGLGDNLGVDFLLVALADLQATVTEPDAPVL